MHWTSLAANWKARKPVFSGILTSSLEWRSVVGGWSIAIIASAAFATPYTAIRWILGSQTVSNKCKLGMMASGAVFLSDATLVRPKGRITTTTNLLVTLGLYVYHYMINDFSPFIHLPATSSALLAENLLYGSGNSHLPIIPHLQPLQQVSGVDVRFLVCLHFR